MENFDLTQFEAADTGVLEVLDMREEPMLVDGKPVTIELYGPGSTQYAKAQAKIDQAGQARVFAAVRGKVAKEGPDEMRRMNAEKLAACTVKINNFPVAPLDLYANPRLGYITTQVAKFLEDWSHFLSPSAKT
jgi:hypothetical protein